MPDSRGRQKALGSAGKAAAVAHAHTLSGSSGGADDAGHGVRWATGRTAIDCLIERGRLESTAAAADVQVADILLQRSGEMLAAAERNVGFSEAAAFSNAYDAYRMAADSLLARQGLRAAGGTGGSHRVVEDAVSSQFGADMDAFEKRTFERFRDTRNEVLYPSSEISDVTAEDAQWAVDIAGRALGQLAVFTGRVRLGLYQPEAGG